jgi:N-sulfoglucosamine sulfohydrolase
MYGLSHDYHHFSSHDHVRSLPVLLNEAGYRTARVGKLHVEPEHVYRFDSTLEADSRNPVEMAERSRSFIEESGSRPFFLYFCPYDPHRDRPFDSWPDPNSFANRPEGYPGIKPVKYRLDQVTVPPFLTDTPECRAELAQYYESISRVDQGLGHLIQILQETNHYSNTLIIYVSDNGSAFPGALATLYEPGMHLPCIVRSPYQKERGITCEAMINWADLTPTILDFAGRTPSTDQFNGRSFKSVLEAAATTGWDEVYASHTFHEVTMYHPMRVVRGRRYKLIWNIAHEQVQPLPRDIKESTTWQALRLSGARFLGRRLIENFLHRPEFELYDLMEDPNELVNLAGESSYQELLAQMKQKLRSFQERTNDPWIITWKDHSGLKVVERH